MKTLRLDLVFLIAFTFLLFTIMSAASAATLGVCGDCNGDGAANILDALLASQHAVGSVTVVSPAYERCNVQGVPGGPTTPATTVDVLDALQIARLAAGLPVTLDCASQPTCSITSPAGGAGSWDVDVVFDLVDLDDDPASIVLEWSTDAGVTWSAATAAPGSPLASPAAGVAPASGLLVIWDSRADLPLVVAPVDLRITVDDGRTAATTCAGSLQLDNSDRAPTCVPGALAPGLQRGDVPVVLDLTDPELDLLDVTVRFDAGSGLQLATPAPASPAPLSTNPAVAVAPAPGLVFLWDSVADVPAVVAGVRVEVTVDDGIESSTCEVFIDIANGPDLAVIACALAPPGGMRAPGDTVDVDRTIGNLGTLPAAGSLERLVLSDDAVVDPGDLLLAEVALAGVSAGGSDARIRTVALPVSTLPGTYWIGVTADSGGVVAETDETNNAAVTATPLTVTSPWNLVAQSVTGRPYATMGLPRRFDRDIASSGTAAVPAFSEDWYLSTDAIITTADLLLASFAHAGLAAGQVESISRDVDIPLGLAPGDWYVGIILDAAGAIGESDETDNAAASTAVPILLEVEGAGSIAAPVGAVVPAAPGAPMPQRAGVTSVTMVAVATYDSSGEYVAAITTDHLEDPLGVTLLDTTFCDPTGKSFSQWYGSGRTFTAPCGDSTEFPECGLALFPNPSNPALSGDYRVQYINENVGPAPAAATIELTSIREFDPTPLSGTLYYNVVVVGDYLSGDALGAGAANLADIIARVDVFYAPLGITTVATVHTIGGATGNMLEAINLNADANGNDVCDGQETLGTMTPLADYEPGETGANVFIVRSITPSGVAGIASGIPGVPVLQGTPHSGVLCSQFGRLFSAMTGGQRQVAAEIIAHELGHELGLWHVTEFSGDPDHDPVPDTPRCLAGTISPASCAGQGAENVMFPQATTNPVTFSTQQGFILLASPGTR